MKNAGKMPGGTRNDLVLPREFFTRVDRACQGGNGKNRCGAGTKAAALTRLRRSARFILVLSSLVEQTGNGEPSVSVEGLPG